MVLNKLFKPKAVQIRENITVAKHKGQYTSYLLALPAEGEQAGYAVRWFQKHIYDLKWDTVLYPHRTEEGRFFTLAVTAKDKEELLSRIDKIMGNAPEFVKLSVVDSPLSLLESTAEALAVGAQKEGGPL